MSIYMGNHTSMPSAVTPGLRYKNLGKSGLRVPNIGLGLWTMLNEDCAEDIIMTALENGINLFDLSEAHCGKYKKYISNHLVTIIYNYKYKKLSNFSSLKSSQLQLEEK